MSFWCCPHSSGGSCRVLYMALHFFHPNEFLGILLSHVCSSAGSVGRKMTKSQRAAWAGSWEVRERLHDCLQGKTPHPVLITSSHDCSSVINWSCCCLVEDSKLMVLLLPGFTIWKRLYCYLVTFPCTFMLIYITGFFDLRQVFFMYNNVINCTALL